MAALVLESNPSLSNDTSASVVTQPAIIPFQKNGVRLDYFQEMINTICGGADNLKDLTTTDVCARYVMPYTAAAQSSLCDMLLSHQHPSVEKAQVFISHAWKFKFLDVVNALEHHFHDQPNIIVWFDLFSNNQHIGPTLTFDWWCGTFKTAIHDMQHVVMVLAPWQDPIPLTRAWCLFELYCAAETGCKFEIAMSSSEEDTFIQGIAMDAETLLLDMMSVIHVERSESFKPEDRAMIFKVVEDTVGFSAINTMVFTEIRGWVVQTTEERVCLLYKRAFDERSNTGDDTAEKPTSCPTTVSDILKLSDMSLINDTLYDVLMSLAVLYRLHSKLVDSEKVYRLCYDWHRQTFGENHRHTLIRLHSLAYSVQQVGDLTKAASLYEECLERQKLHLGDNKDRDADLLLTMNSLAACYQGLGQLQKAEALYRECLQKQEINLGTRDHKHTTSTMNNLATLLDIQGKYTEAETLYLELLAIARRNYGIDHPNTLRIMSNLSTLYQNSAVNRYQEAEELLRECVERRKVILGTDHIDTLNVMGNLSTLLSKTNRVAEAEPILIDVYQRQLALLGPTHPSVLQTMHNVAMLYCDRYFAAMHARNSTHGEDDKSPTYYRDKAEAMFLACLSAKASMELHYETLETQNNLAILYDRCGDLEKAEPLYQAVAAGFESILGSAHPKTHNSQHNLAFLYQKLQRNEKSVEIHRQVLESRYAQYGPVYSGTYSTVFFLALALDAQYPKLREDHSKVEKQQLKVKRRQINEEILQLFRSQLLESISFHSSADEEPYVTNMKLQMHAQLLSGYTDIFVRFSKSFCRRICRHLFRVLCEMVLLMHGGDETHYKVLSHQYALAKLLWRAKPSSSQSISDNMNIDLTISTSTAVGEVEKDEDDDDDERAADAKEAECLFQGVHQQFEKALGKEHVETLMVMADYAKCLHAFAGRLEEAENLYRTAYNRAIYVLPADSTQLVGLVKRYWLLLEDMGKYSEAETLLYPVLWERRGGEWQVKSGA